MNSTDAEFLTASEKEKIYANWEKFINWLATGKHGETSGSDYGEFDEVGIRLFTDRLYKHLSLHCGFIAHYNRHGFFSEYFMSGPDTERFFEHLVNDGGYGDTQDLTSAMIEFYQENKEKIGANVLDETDSKLALIEELVKRAKTDKEFAKKVVAKLLG